MTSSDSPASEARQAARERPVVTPEDIKGEDTKSVDTTSGETRAAAAEDLHPLHEGDALPAQPHYNPYIWSGAMQEEAEEGTQAHAGSPKDPDEPLAERTAVEEALREVYDPEIPVNIYDLGLIYSLEIAEDGTVDVTMTLTAPACPVAGTLPGEVAHAIAGVPGTGEVTVTLTWDPPWDKDKMSEDARLALGLY